MTLLFLALWLQMSAPKPPSNIVRFPCDDSNSAAFVIGSGAVIENSTIEGYNCFFSTGGKKITDITIDGTHFDWCITRKRYTECQKSKPKKPPAKPSFKHKFFKYTDSEKWSIEMKSSPRILIDAEFAEAAQRAADETDGKPPIEFCGEIGKDNFGEKTETCRDSNGQITRIWYPDNPPIPGPEPVDVPAVQVDDTTAPKTETVKGFWEYCYETSMSAVCSMWPPKKTTCADKSRVLLRSENGTAWCHKVQP